MGLFADLWAASALAEALRDTLLSLLLPLEELLLIRIGSANRKDPGLLGSMAAVFALDPDSVGFGFEESLEDNAARLDKAAKGPCLEELLLIVLLLLLPLEPSLPDTPPL